MAKRPASRTSSLYVDALSLWRKDPLARNDPIRTGAPLPMTDPIRVVLADDHPFVRRGLRETLGEAEGIQVIAETSDGTEALAAIRRLVGKGRTPDVLVTDVTMPGLDGFELLSRAVAEIPDLAVVLLSVHPESELALAAFRSGAAGYVEKRAAPDHIVEAVRAVAEGRRYVSQELGERLVQTALDPSSANGDSLSPRELQVVRGIAGGYTREEIAQNLGVSPATITTFKGRAATKIGVRTDAEITRYAFARGLVEVPRAVIPIGTHEHPKSGPPRDCSVE